MSVVGGSRQREKTPTTHAKSRQIAMGSAVGLSLGQTESWILPAWGRRIPDRPGFGRLSRVPPGQGKAIQLTSRATPEQGRPAGDDQPFTRTRTSAGIASKEAVGRSCLACHLGPGPRI
jgi:hypothetical protein